MVGRPRACPMRLVVSKLGSGILATAGALLFLLAMAGLGGCGCGFDCNNGNNNNGPSVLDLGFSADAPETLKQVVIEVDRITLVRSGGDDVTIDRFTIDEIGVVDADTFRLT